MMMGALANLSTSSLLSTILKEALSPAAAGSTHQGGVCGRFTLTGKTNFGFVAKYKQGDTCPSGRTEFQFKEGNLNFHAESYGWLVVDDSKAIYEGTGTVNGTGDYGFFVVVIDGQSCGSDTFRIKIWDKSNSNGDVVIYDNHR